MAPNFVGFQGTAPPVELQAGVVRGASPARGGPQPASSQPGGTGEYVLPLAEGVQVTGYARNTDLIRNFVENLKKTHIQLPTNWYLWVAEVVFDHRDVDKYPFAVLWDPQAREVSPFADKDAILYSFRVVVMLRTGRDLPTPPPEPAVTDRAAGAQAGHPPGPSTG